MQATQGVPMNAFLSMLRVPLALETANVLVHRIAHWTYLGNTYVDTASSFVSVAIVFYAGWVVSRLTRRIVKAIFAGLIVWALSLSLVALLMAMEILFATGLRAGESAAAIAGLMLSSILILPAVIAVAAIAALIARRGAP